MTIAPLFSWLLQPDIWNLFLCFDWCNETTSNNLEERHFAVIYKRVVGGVGNLFRLFWYFSSANMEFMYSRGVDSFPIMSFMISGITFRIKNGRIINDVQTGSNSYYLQSKCVWWSIKESSKPSCSVINKLWILLHYTTKSFLLRILTFN